MKKTIFKFGLFLLAVLLPTGCSSDEEEIKGVVIEEINCGNELSQFLNEHLPMAAAGMPSFFYDKEGSKVHNILTINSKEEFSEIFPEFDTAFLSIDFSKNTLVIGHKSYASNIGDKHPDSLERKRLYRSEDGYIIDLKYTYTIIKTGLCQLEYVNFWGVYPKLQAIPFSINLIFE